MRILVTGGTGFLGMRLVKKLVSQGDEVVVFSDKPEDLGVKVVAGDIRDKAELRKVFSKVDIVYHLAACLDEANPDLWDINVKGTQNVAELCKEQKVKQLIFMSSSGVLGETNKAAKETMPYNPKTEYERSKAEAEKIIKNSGVHYTIVRTTIIIGPNAIWASIFEAARRGYPIIGSGRNYFHLVYIDDVIDLLTIVKQNKKAYDQVFHIATKDTPTYEEVYQMIAEQLRVPVPTKHIPVKIALLSARMHVLSCNLSGKKPKLVKMKSSIDRLVRNRILSIEKAGKILAFHPKYTTPHAIRETIKYLQIARLGYSDEDLAHLSKVKP
ncbi:MAG: NAD-dependent epimerase/dehydratase family protein [Candidatus Aenigmarchaeota archaeon]|nr:NAD-dependent epimerase/dehydratase family protein [Candidatus Aenigmarchaeota archaeon]